MDSRYTGALSKNVKELIPEYVLSTNKLWNFSMSCIRNSKNFQHVCNNYLAKMERPSQKGYFNKYKKSFQTAQLNTKL